MIAAAKRGLAGAAVAACAIGPPGVAALRAQEVIELPAEDRRLEADFEELYRVGSMLGDEWDTFGQVADVGFDGAGNLYILDGQAARITVVDLQGGLLRQFGRLGEGPGEFSRRGTWALAVGGDGRATVYDANRLAFVRFDANGDFERSIRLEGPTRFISIPGLQAEAASASVVSTGEVQYLDLSPPPQPSFRYVMRYRLSGEQAGVDTVTAGWKPPGPGGMDFVPVFRVGVLPDGGVAFTDSSDYAIKVAGPDGGPSRILTRPFRPLPLTDRMKADYIERHLGDADALAGPASDFLRAQLESIDSYHEIPVVRDLRTSREGTIWVRRGGDELGSDGPIDLITGDGRYLGTFATGATGMPAAFGPYGLVAFVERNDLDVATVAVKRLPPGAM